MVAHRNRLDNPCGVKFTQHLYEDLRFMDLRQAALSAGRHASNSDGTCRTIRRNLIILP